MKKASARGKTPAQRLREVITADKMPNLRDMSSSDIVDMIGPLRAELSKFKRMEKYLTEALKARGEPGDNISGKNWVAELQPGVWAGLDKDMIQEEYGEQWIQAHTKTSEYVKVVIRPVVKD